MTHAERYTFEDCVLDVAERQLWKGSTRLPLAPKAHDLLVALVRRAGCLVAKADLLQEVWPDAFVEEGILAVHVSALRKALEDGRRPARCIETVARSGYRFIAPVTPMPGARSTNGDRPLRQTAVYEHVGRGRLHLLSAAMKEMPLALQEFQRAVELDSTYAEAHAGVALAYCAQAELRVMPAGIAFGNAKGAAIRAIALDDVCADAHVALGTVLFLSEWDWIGAERSFVRALDLNPSHTEARLAYGRLLDALGRGADALDQKRRALEHDPLSPRVHLQMCMSYWNQRQYTEAIDWANKALAIDPRHLLAREFLAGAYWALGDFDRHMAENLKHAESYGISSDALEPLRRTYETGGRTAVVQASIAQAQASAGRVPDLQMAVLCAEIRDLDTAFERLRRAIDARDPCLVDLAVAPQWDPLRADPRFAACLATMGLPHTT
jgi:DNA-binding winged helix-turn-helix (wHTH) protein/Flp pilus assembly protein TadD